MLSRTAGSEPVRRSGAKVGDSICVSGSLGAAIAGKHLEFVPRVSEAIRLAQMVTLHSMIDISDGLSSDLSRICRQSKVGAVIEAQQIPISDEAGKSDGPLSSALNDGEDFELLFTLGQADCKNLLERWDQQLSITQIGAITEDGKVQIRRGDGRISDLGTGGYEHLK
jgi:thiamine-monophosphate kinase